MQKSSKLISTDRWRYEIVLFYVYSGNEITDYESDPRDFQFP